MRLTTFASIILTGVLAGAPQAAARRAGGKRLTLALQRRTAGADRRLRITAATETVDSAKVAVVVCDMWNYHWCKTLLARSAAREGTSPPTPRQARSNTMTKIRAASPISPISTVSRNWKPWN